MKARRLVRWFVPSWAVLRVTAYAAFAFSVASLLAARVLYADVKEAALSIGHELAQVADLLEGNETILLNGERMHHASTYVEQDVSVVLDRLEAYCSAAPSFVGRAMNALPKELVKKAEKDLPNRASRLGIVRTESKGRGMVACFVDDTPSGISDFKVRLERFVSTMRLGEFGRFRYFYAEQKGETTTHVVSTWADTGLDIRAMFPSDGDAAGVDSRVVPRPANARRTLSAGAEGAPYGVWMYTSTDAIGKVESFYDEFMKKGGFDRVETSTETRGTRAFLREDGYQVFLSTGDKDGQTLVTLIEAGFVGRPNVAAVQVTSE